jgi:hypothetical protein
MFSWRMRFLHCFVLSLIIAGTSINAAPRTKCPPREHWVVPHHRRAYTRGDGTFVSASEIEGYCRKNSSDFHVWNIKLKNGRPPSWRFGAEKSVDWTAEETERALEALEETPSFLRNLDVDAIYRMKEASNPANPAAMHGTDIVLYDKAFDSTEILAHILNHEMAHLLFDTLSQKDQISYRSTARWEEKRQLGPPTYVPGRPESQFLRPNGRLSYEEDFADNVAAFIHQPSRLKAVSPEIFGWMDKHLKPRLSKGSRK